MLPSSTAGQVHLKIKAQIFSTFRVNNEDVFEQQLVGPRHGQSWSDIQEMAEPRFRLGEPAFACS